jgi:hypothetical protein
MRKLITILAITLLISGLIGCEKYVTGFEADPLSPVDAGALKQFVGAQLNYALFTEGTASWMASIWAQQARGADRQFSAFEVYNVTNGDYGNDWALAYRALSNLRTVQDKATAAGQTNLKGVAEILEGFHMGTVAAVWGDVPYSQAAQPDVTLTPAYDGQLAVYTAVQAELDRGIADLTASTLPITQDVFTSAGSATRWLKLGHSAKARYLMHTARSQGYSAAILNQIITEAQQGILATNGTEDMKMTHGATQNGNQNPWYDFMANNRSGYIDAVNNFAIPMMNAAKLVDLKTDEVGRLAFYFTANGNDFNRAAGGAYAVDASYPLFRASETHLLMAEAYVRLGNTASALTELNSARTYNNSVFGNKSASFVAADFPTTAALQQAIFNETYLSLMNQIEAWNFLRRIDFAISYKNSSGATVTMTPRRGTEFPQRFVYSVDEFTANPNMPKEVTNAQFVRTAVNK